MRCALRRETLDGDDGENEELQEQGDEDAPPERRGVDSRVCGEERMGADLILTGGHEEGGHLL